MGAAPTEQNPVLPFLVFFGNGKENHQKNKDFFYPCRTPEIPAKEGKNAQKTKEFLAREKNKEFQKNKERKDRESDVVGSPRRWEGGGTGPLLKIPEGGGGFSWMGGAQGEGVCGELEKLGGGGGGAKSFSSGPKCPPRIF